jgi:hypothetical protein
LAYSTAMPDTRPAHEDLASMKVGLQRLQEQLLDLSQQAIQMSAAISKMMGDEAESENPNLEPTTQPTTREVTVVDSWTSLSPVAMRLGREAENSPVDSWREVFRQVVTRLHNERPQEIANFIHARSRTNPRGFGRSPQGMHSPFRVQDDAFVSLCQSANDFRGHLKMLLGFSRDYSPTMLKISVAEDTLPPSGFMSDVSLV